MRGEYSLSTPYEQLTPAEIAAAKHAAKTRKVTTLSVCADPGNMPLSDNKQQGFQNKIIEVVAEQLGAPRQLLLAPLPGARTDARNVRQRRMRHPSRHAVGFIVRADDHPDLSLDLRVRLPQRTSTTTSRASTIRG